MDQEKRSRSLKALEKRGFSMGGVGAAAKTLGGGALKSLPVLGNVLSGGSALYNMAKGNWGSAALDAAGMIPGYGNAIQFGRMGYELGKGIGGQPQQQPPSPQGLPNYGKMASLKVVDDRGTRGLAFEAGVERFCKEASFDDDDRVALYRIMIKLSDDGTVPQERSLIDANPTGNVLLSPDQDPRLDWTTRLWRFGGKAWDRGFLNTAKDVVDYYPTKWNNQTAAADKAIAMDKLHKTNPAAWQARMDQSRTGGDATSEYLALQKDKTFSKAKDFEAQGFDPNTAIMKATQGLPGDYARMYSRKYVEQGKPPGTSGQGGQATPAAAPMPGVTPAKPPAAAPPGRTAPAGPSGGYMTGSPPPLSTNAGGAGGMASNPMQSAPGATMSKPTSMAPSMGGSKPGGSMPSPKVPGM